MCSSCCCFWSANVVCFCRLRELSLDVLRPWIPADLADATLCKSFSLGRFGMVETGLDSRCSTGETSFALRLASKRVDWLSLLNRLSTLSLLVRLSRARLWWNIAPLQTPGVVRTQVFLATEWRRAHAKASRQNASRNRRSTRYVVASPNATPARPHAFRAHILARPPSSRGSCSQRAPSSKAHAQGRRTCRSMLN